jgi:dipeptidyl aminopeptidase/acylaminoacyl peptidase
MANFFGGYGTDQYVRDYEIELGAPWDKPDLWRKLSYPFFEAPRITAPTLYLCAAKDNNVPCSGAEQMYQALRSVGVPTQLVIYPDEHHGLTTPSHIEDRLQRHLDWYDRYLMPATPKP